MAVAGSVTRNVSAAGSGYGYSYLAKDRDEVLSAIAHDWWTPEVGIRRRVCFGVRLTLTGMA